MKKKKEKSHNLKAMSVRIDPAKLKEAAALGIDLSNLFRDKLDQELLERAGACPTCGQKMKKKNWEAL